MGEAVTVATPVVSGAAVTSTVCCYCGARVTRSWASGWKWFHDVSGSFTC